MNKTIFVMSIALMLLLSMSVLALDQPKAKDPFSTITIPFLSVTGENSTSGPPIAPGTGTEQQCLDWEIKDEYCIGDVRHYSQCQKLVSGNLWQDHSEVCNLDNPNNVCFDGKCTKRNDILLSVLLIVGIFGILVFIVTKFFGGKRK